MSENSEKNLGYSPDIRKALLIISELSKETFRLNKNLINLTNFFQ